MTNVKKDILGEEKHLDLDIYIPSLDLAFNYQVTHLLSHINLTIIVVRIWTLPSGLWQRPMG